MEAHLSGGAVPNSGVWLEVCSSGCKHSLRSIKRHLGLREKRTEITWEEPL